MAKGLWLDRRISRYLDFWRHQMSSSEMKVRQRQQSGYERTWKLESWAFNGWIKGHVEVHWRKKENKVKQKKKKKDINFTHTSINKK